MISDLSEDEIFDLILNNKLSINDFKIYLKSKTFNNAVVKSILSLIETALDLSYCGCAITECSCGLDECKTKLVELRKIYETGNN